MSLQRYIAGEPVAMDDGGSRQVILAIGVDDAQARLLSQRLEGVRNGLTKAITLAVNKTARAARTKIVRALAGRIDIKQSELKRRNVFQHLASYDRQTAEINIRGGRLLLGSFRIRPSRPSPRQQRRLQGTLYRVARGGAWQTHVHGFTARLASGHIGVFSRWAAGGGAGRPGRLPIHEARGPSVPEIYEGAAELAETAMAREVNESLDRNLSAIVAALVEGKGPGTRDEGSSNG